MIPPHTGPGGGVRTLGGGVPIAFHRVVFHSLLDTRVGGGGWGTEMMRILRLIAISLIYCWAGLDEGSVFLLNSLLQESLGHGWWWVVVVVGGGGGWGFISPVILFSPLEKTHHSPCQNMSKHEIQHQCQCCVGWLSAFRPKVLIKNEITMSQDTVWCVWWWGGGGLRKLQWMWLSESIFVLIPPQILYMKETVPNMHVHSRSQSPQ